MQWFGAHVHKKKAKPIDNDVYMKSASGMQIKSGKDE